MDIRRLAAATAAILCLATPASASIIFTANMTTSQEPPPVNLTLTTGGARPVPFGTATFVLNDAGTALTMTATIFNIDVTGAQTADINDNLVAAHIHATSNPAFTPPGTAGVVWGFFGMPFNNTMPNEGLLTPFASGVGGTFTGTWNELEGQNTTLAAQLANIFAGRSYINFHTTQNPGGEIRGALLAVVPEPMTWATMLVGFGAIGYSIRRRRSGKTLHLA
jgi:hypothetical protein